MTRVHLHRIAVGLACLTLAHGLASAQVPPEVGGVRFASPDTLAWDPASGADDYNVYRGLESQLRAGAPLRCHGDEISDTTFVSPDAPGPGQAFLYLVTAESAAGEGTPGADSGANERALLGRCDAVVRDHALLRIGFGPDEWTRDRLETLGLAGYIDEQLAPLSIAEGTELSSRLDPITPPDTLPELIAQPYLRATYSRRQLEQSATLFWTNHFNTNYSDIVPFFNRAGRDAALVQTIATELQYRETTTFRTLAFTGTFRDIVEASTLSPAMILFLDTDQNIATAPNENMARELLELYAMGVDGGYTQADVIDLARVLSGWNVCKKTAANQANPVAPCINRLFEDVTPGTYVANFRPAQHDTGQKILFAGTPQEVVIPDTSASPTDGVDDLEIALDAIAAHPSTRRFISKKLLGWFVTDTPSASMIDDIALVWQNTNGSLLDVLRAVVTHPEASNPDLFRNKVKTPFEHMVSGLRATRGKISGLNGAFREYIARLRYIPHTNPVPTGYPELSSAWVDTNNLLERQNYGLDLTSRTAAAFGTDLILLMSDNGLNASSDPNDIVDFWIDVLFAGAIAPGERAEALAYLTTDDNGVPAPVDNTRIRELVGFLMGYPQFLEQ